MVNSSKKDVISGTFIVDPSVVVSVSEGKLAVVSTLSAVTLVDNVAALFVVLVFSAAVVVIALSAGVFVIAL